MREVTVRQASDQDSETIVTLWHELMAVHQELVPLVWTLTDDAEARYREHLANMMEDENRRVLVSEQEGEVVGYLVVEKSARPPVLAHSNYGVFEEICVAPSARRAGVGKALVSVGLEWCEGKGLCAAQVGYAADNPMSVPFWEGLGFRRYQISGVRALGARQPNHSASTVDLSSSYPETHPASRILVQPLSWYSRQSLIPLFREAAQDGTGC